MVTRRGSAGPFLYGVLWVVGVPGLLLWWAHATSAAVPLPALHSVPAGTVLAGGGLALIALGALALGRFGGGLPMNAYPPPRFADRGIYRWLAHPIYVGCVLLTVGVAIVAGSASGLWLVTPITALAFTALVFGYERHDLRSRFGALPYTPRISLPRSADGPADAWERLSVYVLVLLPWLLAYEAVHLLGVPPDAIDSRFPFERTWPVLEWTELVYASTYAFILATPLLVRSRRALRHFAVTGLLATALVTFLYVTVPLISPPRTFEPSTALGRLLALEQSMSNTVAAFPAFHVLWPLIAADALRSRGRAWGAIAFGYAAIIAASCITTGMHSLADIAFAVVLFFPLRSYDRIWDAMRHGAERVANSWREWRVGPVRILNHGFYTGAAGLAGTWLIGWLAGPDRLLPVVAVALFALIVSAVWAQFLEGSPKLLRPLGYYGGILGGLVGTAILALAGMDVLTLLGAFAVAMPWVQAAGRMRCLVQGCCHGGPTSPRTGIRYVHSRSRVTQIAGLTGVPLHPTPLYSILSNLVTGVLLLRLWWLHASPALVLGLYFLLNAIARFIEESFRAEPQTPIVARMRLYQWLALAAFIAGIVFTTLDAEPPALPGNPAHPLLLSGALLVGLVAWFLTGIDFPASNRRFSRLAAADEPARLLHDLSD